MANVIFNLITLDNAQYTGSVYLRPRDVQTSGSVIVPLDPVSDCSNPFVFENVISGFYECTASNQAIESPLFCILVPTGSDTYDAGDLEFPPTSRSLHWVPDFSVSASWADFAGTASFIRLAQSASYILGANVKGIVLSASYAIRSGDADTLGGLSGSYFTDASNLRSGYVAKGLLTGSYNVTASFAVSASYAVSASHAERADQVPASGIIGTVSSASYAGTASFALNVPSQIASGSLQNITASWALNALTASAIDFTPRAAVSASWASQSFSASVAEYARIFGGQLPDFYLSASNLTGFVLPARLSGSYQITSSVAQTALTASYVQGSGVSGLVASASTAISASWAPQAAPVTSVPSSSWSSASLSASYALSASWAPNLYPIQTGSFLNVTASRAVSASVAVSASYAPTPSLVPSASFAVSASWAPQAAPVTSVPSASWSSASLSASYAPTILASGSSWNISASWALNALSASAITFVPYAALSASWASSSISSSYGLSASFAQHLGYNPEFLWQTSGNGPDLKLSYLPTPIGGGIGFVDTNGTAYLAITADGEPITIYTNLKVLGNVTVEGVLYATASAAVSSSYAVSASRAQSAFSALSASFAQNSLTASYLSGSHVRTADTASYSFSASFSISGGFATSASYSVTASFADSASVARSASYSVSSSYAFSASYANQALTALTASKLVGLTYESASYFLNVTGSNLIVMQKVTASYNKVDFNYFAQSGSNFSEGTLKAAWLGGDSSSFRWTNYGSMDFGTVDLEANIVLSGNSVQFRVFAPQYAGWFVKAWAIYF